MQEERVYSRFTVGRREESGDSCLKLTLIALIICASGGFSQNERFWSILEEVTFLAILAILVKAGVFNGGDLVFRITPTPVSLVVTTDSWSRRGIPGRKVVFLV